MAVSYKLIGGVKPVRRALGIIDVAATFMDIVQHVKVNELPVEGAERVVAQINRLVLLPWNTQFATLDWHPWKPQFSQDHCSFADRWGKTPFSDSVQMPYGTQHLYTRHGLAGTPYANFHPQLNTLFLESIWRKGMDPDIDSYSGYMDAAGNHTGLGEALVGAGITDVFHTGLVTNICVKFNALDAVKFGLKSYLIEDACVPFLPAPPPNDMESSLEQLDKAGVKIVRVTDVVRMMNPDMLLPEEL